MTYLMQNAIAVNLSMQGRVAASAAEQAALHPAIADTVGDPDSWMYRNRREWAAAPGWDDAWAYALALHPPAEPIDPPPPPQMLLGYDPGADEAVITDAMILSQVQAMLLPEPPPMMDNTLPPEETPA